MGTYNDNTKNASTVNCCRFFLQQKYATQLAEQQNEINALLKRLCPNVTLPAVKSGGGEPEVRYCIAFADLLENF